MTEPVSSCCGSTVRVAGRATLYWVCTMCAQPCDAVPASEFTANEVETHSAPWSYLQPPTHAGQSCDVVQDDLRVPTVEEILASAAGPCGNYCWDVKGGRIQVDRDTLLAALNDAYDPGMPNWPALVEAHLPT